MHHSTPFDTDQMIAATASAPGPAGRGIVRLSGAKTIATVSQFLSCYSDSGLNLNSHSSLRYETFLRIPAGEQSPDVRFKIDIYLWPTGRSYTGQPAAEIHTIGSPIILNWLLTQLYQWGVRPANPGEFTLRSFLNGKINLLQAEAVLGVIDAQSGHQLDSALQQLAGGISGRMRQMRDAMLDDLADLEAGLDFVEEDIEFVNRSEFRARLHHWLESVHDLHHTTQNRMHQESGYKIVLAGLPNAGKSTLFNCLTGSNALISPLRGTTTDLLTAPLSIDGIDVKLYDTAGWEERWRNEIDEKSQQFRQEIYERADLILWCRANNLTPAEWQEEEIIWQKLQSGVVPSKLILTKTDCQSLFEQQEQADRETWCRLSVASGAGIDELKKQLKNWLNEQENQTWELLGSSAARCQDSLRRTADHLRTALELSDAGAGDEFLAEELRGVITELGVILGHVYTDDLLDRVFSKFCIGK